MTRPRIGLTCDTANARDGREPRCICKRSYVRRVVEAGGLPVLFPQDAAPADAAALLALVDGVVLTGGDDYQPSRYTDAPPHPELTLVDPAREAFDFALVAALRETDHPVLGICNGLQLMAVDAGGTLHQHLPDVVGGEVAHHEPTPCTYPHHPIAVEPDSRLAAILGPAPHVANSRHHQAVDDPGALRVTARSPDGIVEALEAGGERFYLGVQWHPEEHADGEPAGAPLFAALVAAARERAARREEAARNASDAQDDRYQELADLLEQSLFEMDLAGRFTFANQHSLDAFGFEAADLARGVSVLEVIAPEEQARAMASIGAVFRGEHVGPNEYTAVRRDGSRFPALVISAPIVREDAVVGVRGFLVDITAQKASEARLRRSEARFKELTELLPEAVFEADLTGRVTFVNQRALELTGYSAAEVAAGISLLDLAGPADHERVAANLAKILRGEPPDFDEYTVVRKDGTTFPIMVEATAILQDGAPVGLRAVAVDITERRRIERELARRNAELVQANLELEKLHRLKDEFVAVVSHELRTPLVTGRGYVELALDGTLGEIAPEVREGLEVGLRNLRRLSELVDEVVSYHGLLRRELAAEPSRETLDLGALIQESVAELIIRTGRSLDSLPVELADDLPAAHADKEMVRRVLSNLLNNAVRHAGRGARVLVRATAVGAVLRVAVCDDGAGMPAEVRRRAFEAFYRGVESPGGSGLGLAIVRSIVEAHGGEVELESAPGAGTTVTFTLPAGAGAAAAPGVAEVAASPRTSAVGSARVLVVEDHEDTAEFLRLALTGKGFVVQTVASAEAALEVLDHEGPDLLLVDLVLPGKSGTELCQEVRARGGALGTVPFYIITAHAEDEARTAAEAAGCTGFILKPVAMADLLEQLTAAVRGAVRRH